ncbi:hypothetical protein FHR90_003400 [Endobacter medicaginis]|uniref:Uncharacterized protein n=1 Tax=Endobacter medicaginis TaxID=1181271 RepID=A0A850NPF4_9PROT|nr:XF1762 family protein [Endobacter medicaginis]MBB3175544.1 hypothetical protein [Endobacter medicaginis]MCX5476583.1 hypothetical protein [Endobacter medicaginis]NVN29035.1 hypothetical protein [Endobacter medicaginis]
MPTVPLTCCLCDGLEHVALSEIWSSREFSLETCCEGLHEQICRDIEDDPRWGAELLRRLGAGAFCGERLRRVADDELGGLVLDWKFRFEPISFLRAARFVQRHHEHCDAPTGWKFGQGLFNGTELIAVVMVGNPLSRAYMHRGWLEVTRLCARRDRPSALRWNACSALYGWAAQEAMHRGAEKIVTYTRHDEPGASLRAAGWVNEGRAGGRSWDTPSRRRARNAQPIARIRWGKCLGRGSPMSGTADRLAQ